MGVEEREERVALNKKKEKILVLPDFNQPRKCAWKPLFTPCINAGWHLRCRLNTDRKHVNTLIRKYFVLLAPEYQKDKTVCPYGNICQ